LKRLLSPRQAEIAELVRRGKTSREIGEQLFIDWWGNESV
jgi:DNA-binding CsgD family transcriptional regulator